MLAVKAGGLPLVWGMTMFAGLVMVACLGVQALAQQDMSQVQIKTNKIANNFYTLDGNGGTIGVLSGPDGAFMVDSQFAPLTEKIVAAIMGGARKYAETRNV